ncbi:MAG: phytanoyl-CoA dioxygenase family protein [Candidatus Poribacteria bacterium]|nr:phytanoyl-CoA dioxygenase family protein [Candidatus Poribacteria bacterium]MDE0504004.1 phytanoyl-CoA dioxygenase family protein [Candidatus Poribacteria bacterium]
MEFVKLKDKERHGFETDGFLIVPQAIDSNTVKRLMEASDRLMKITTNDPHPDNIYAYRREGVVRDSAFDSLISNPRVVPLIVQLLSNNIHLHTATLIYKKPHKTVPARAWHRDIGISNDLGHAGLPRVGIKACYCLTDFLESDSGMTLMARGSQHLNSPLTLPDKEVDPPTVFEPRLRAGDAVLFENRVFHTAAPNLSNRISKVVIYGYAYRWMKPDVHLDVPDREALSRASDDVQRQLLGAYRKVDSPPHALDCWAERHGVKRKATQE